VNDVRLAALRVPGSAQPWADIGFDVVDDAVALANGAIRFGAAVCSLVVDGVVVDRVELEGIPIEHGEMPSPVGHANGAVELDHVVVMTDSVDRTSAAVAEVLGLEQRRIRETETVRQGFHRFADVGETRGCIVEVVERPGAGVALWGVVMIVDDIDAAVERSNGLVGAPRDAVQPGRRIATVSRSAGLPVAVALMSR
jgi:hypothetical protein